MKLPFFSRIYARERNLHRSLFRVWVKQNRSRFVRQALAERLERISRRKFETLLAEGYQVMAEQDLKDAEAYLGTFQDIGEE